MKDFDDTALKICRDQMTLGQINPWSSQVCFPPVAQWEERKAGRRWLHSAWIICWAVVLKLEIRIQPSINNCVQFCNKCFNKYFTWIKMGLDYDLYGAHSMCFTVVLKYCFLICLYITFCYAKLHSAVLHHCSTWSCWKQLFLYKNGLI